MERWRSVTPEQTINQCDSCDGKYGHCCECHDDCFNAHYGPILERVSKNFHILIEMDLKPHEKRLAKLAFRLTGAIDDTLWDLHTGLAIMDALIAGSLHEANIPRVAATGEVVPILYEVPGRA